MQKPARNEILKLEEVLFTCFDPLIKLDSQNWRKNKFNVSNFFFQNIHICHIYKDAKIKNVKIKVRIN